MVNDNNTVPKLRFSEKPLGHSAAELAEISNVNLANIDPLKYARDYSISCYPENCLYDDEQKILQMIVARQALIGAQEKLLDIGSASIISYAMALSGKIKQVYMADIIEPHLELISEWVQKAPTARSWNAHTQYILEIENQSTNQKTIETRENHFRQKLAAIAKGDLTAKLPMGSHQQFPVVSCFYATEQAASHATDVRDLGQSAWKRKWFEVMVNLTSLVTPGGFLVMALVHNSSFYVISDHLRRPQKIDIANITTSDVMEALAINGFDLKSSLVSISTPEGLEDEGISEVILVHAKKMHAE